MKRFLFLLPFYFFLLPFLSLPFGEGWGGAFSQGFVTLQGRQFYDHQGNPFYPVVVNYGVNLPHINDGNTNTLSNFEIAPDGSIGGTNGYDHPAFDKGADRILVDFLKIKSMGFNAVRLLHMPPTIFCRI